MTEYYDPRNDYKKIKSLADNPHQMATRIVNIEKAIKTIQLFNDPDRKSGFIEQMKRIAADSQSDPESAHSEADDLLLEYINDEEITKAYGEVKRWFA